MKTIYCVITARPSYSRIRSFLLEINKDPNYDLKIILASSAIISNYGDIRKTVENDGLKMQSEISNMLFPQGIKTMPKTTALQLYELSILFESEEIDAVITIADRYETIATSIAASYLNIPLIHIQGGEITGNIDEKTRHANTKLADLHLACSELAKERIIKMGENPKMVFNCGCPSIDLAKEAINSEYNIKEIINCYNGVGEKTESYFNDYIVLLQHPETDNFDHSEKQIINTLNALKYINKQIFVFWPNSDAGTDGTAKGIRKFREANKPNNFYFFKNFKPDDFIRLIKHAKLLVGNSSVGLREASFISTPVLNIGDRQMNRDRGNNVTDCPHDTRLIRQNIEKLLISDKKIEPNYLYGNGDAGKRMLNALNEFDYSFTKDNIWD